MSTWDGSGDREADGSSRIVDGRFELERVLGMGGMGEVWRAKQVPLGRLVALKVLRPEYSKLPHLRRRFAREARAAARLSHKHIASVFDFGTDEEGRMFIAMEYVEGPSLVEMMAWGLSVKHVVDLGYQLLDALAHAHARGVIHRDLKPENILVSGGVWPHRLGDAKIVDFGIAKVRDERPGPAETGHDQVVGTPLYMSPEQAGGQRDLSMATDIYSLGLILYEALAQTHPFADADSLAVMTAQIQTPLPPLTPRPGVVVPPVLEAIILRSLAKEVGERWHSAAQMRAELEPLRILVRTDARYERLPASSEDPRSEAEWAKTKEDQQRVSAGSRQAPTRIELPSKMNKTTDIDGPKPPVSALRPSIPSLRETPFVGRLVQRDVLLEAASQVLMDERGQMLLITGEAGMGKSRLVRWLREVLEERGLFTGHVGAFYRGASNGLGGVQEVFESLCGTRNLVGEAFVARVSAVLESWGAPGAMVHDVEALGQFLRPVGRPQGKKIKATPGRLFASLSNVLAAACAHAPRLVVLEDVHWASEELLAFMDYLAAEFRQGGYPLFFVGTMRQESWAKREELQQAVEAMSRHIGEVFEHQVLAPMSLEDSCELVRTLLPSGQELTELIATRAAGNPLHLLVLTRHLSNQELLESDEEGVWHAKDLAQAKEALPPSLADLFRLKLRDLGLGRGHQRHVLIRCAILGRRFSYDVLEKVHELESSEAGGGGLESLDETFDELLYEGLVVEEEGRGEEWYAFRYSLLRDVLLQEDVGPSARRRLHRLAALALEQVHVHALDAVALDVAQHWRAAKRSEEAIGWAWRGAQSARRGYRLRDALEGYSSCVEMMNQRLGVDPFGENVTHYVLDPARFERAAVGRSRYLRAMVYAGDLHEGFGEFDRAIGLYRQVIRMCGKAHAQMDIEVLVPLCQAWLGLGHVSWQRGDFLAAMWAFERVYDVLSQTDIAPDIVNSAQRGLARVVWHRGEYDQAMRLATRAHEHATGFGDVEAQAESLWIMGEVARMLGGRERAKWYFDQAQERYTKVRSPTGQARILLSLAQMARHAKSYEEARELFGEALAKYEGLGDRRGQGLCLNGLGEISRFQDDLDGAYACYIRALEIFESIGAQYDIAVTTTNLGLVELRRRHVTAAERYLQDALELVVQKDYPYLLAGIGYNLALIKTMRGKGQEATEILAPVWEMHARVPIADVDFAVPLEELGRMHIAQGEQRAAAALLHRARMFYDKVGSPKDLERVDGLLGLLDGMHQEPGHPFEDLFEAEEEP